MKYSVELETALPTTTSSIRADARLRSIQDIGESTVIVGISGARRNAAAAAVLDGILAASCQQERMTRVPSVGLKSTGLPTEALDGVLGSIGRCTTDVATFVSAEARVILPPELRHIRLDHHFGHAATAALTSPFQEAAVLVCDEKSNPPISIWSYTGGQLINQNWPSSATGFASLYSDCVGLFGLGSRCEHRLEALARLDPGHGYERLTPFLSWRGGLLQIDPAWKTEVASWLAECGGEPNVRKVASAASSFQRCVGDILVALIREIRSGLPHPYLCLGGGLFYNTYFNTRVVESGLFDRVFIPLNPGNSGVAAGAALAVARQDHLFSTATSPFLGPEYDLEQIKAILDNCKLTYEFLNAGEIIDAVVNALMKGKLVGWYQGRMEWGPRALGNRSILASPFCPHVLDNLNVFLKRRERYRAYGLSVCEEEAPRHFVMPAPSPYMELDYKPLDPDRFRYVIPEGASTVRVQTVEDQPKVFRDIHRAFAAVTGAGVLVNTSFNGFNEPIVCTPRDAIRVFFGTGLDMLVLGRFVIMK